MKLSHEFAPPKRRGILIHLSVILIIISISVVLILVAYKQKSEGIFTLLLVGGVLALIPLPLIAYSSYALIRAKYLLDRDGLRILWGLQNIDIPIEDIEWIRPYDEMGYKISLPPLRFSGVMLGSSKVRDLGKVEFLASEKKDIIIITTIEGIYAISPAEPRRFMNAFQNAIEMGSIAPLSRKSTRATNFLLRAWQNRWIKISIIMGIALTLTLLIAVNFIIPTKETILLGYSPPIEISEPVPSNRLLLFPILSFISYVFDLILGLFLYREPENQTQAYFILASSAITPIFFIAALFFIYI